MNDNIPELKIELMADGQGDGLILLEQDSGGNIDRVAIHPIHLRYIAEKMGLVREVSASEADTMRMMIELQRRLLALKDRIHHLGEYLALHSDHRHADLTYEVTYATATADICEAYCADFIPDIENEVTPPQTENNPVGSQAQLAGLFDVAA